MAPELYSASMDICLPGRPSRVKRAATSAMRVAPFVMTIACTAMMTMKMMKPMTRPSAPPEPTTKEAKALIILTLNFEPWERMSLIVEILRARPKTVVTRSMVGKIENSVAFFVKSTMRRMRIATVRLKARRASRRIEGTGMMIMRTTATALAATARSEGAPHQVLANEALGISHSFFPPGSSCP